MYVLRLMIMLVALAPVAVQAEGRDCLDGYELTAIVVLENDIKQSVEAYACRMAFPEDSSTYTVYSQLRGKWHKQRTAQRDKRDKVYQRIYGDIWQNKIDEWTQSMAVSSGQEFDPTDIACHDLRNELFAHIYDWDNVYKSAAREAASEKYDALRCEAASVIQLMRQ